MTSNRPGGNVVGILGSGFGLYGYLPVLAVDNTIVLLDKYKFKFDARPELTQFKDKIEWVDENAFYNGLDGLVICLSPGDQFSSVSRALAFPNIRFFILEKPLAIDPERSEKLLDAMIGSGRDFRIGYNFQYTTWAKELSGAFKSADPLKIKIKWGFLAHHYAKNIENWKRYNNTGGGAIRFYGIHLMALLAGAPLCRIISSSSGCLKDEDIYKWTAQFSVNTIHLVEIELDSAATTNCFEIAIRKAEDNYLIRKMELNDPFDEYISSSGEQDRRIGVIKPVLASVTEKNRQTYWNKVYRRTNNLWQEIEQINIASYENI